MVPTEETADVWCPPRLGNPPSMQAISAHRETLSESIGTAGRLDTNELFEQWREHGDRRARDELVERFLPLARKLARRYARARAPFHDLLLAPPPRLLHA